MKITSPTQALQNAFQIVGAVVPSRPTRPILANVLVRATGDKLELLATDREISMRLEVGGVTVEQEGEAAIPQARVSAILNESADESLHLSVEGGRCIITTSDSEFRLSTENAEEFPEIPQFSAEGAFEFDRADFVDMVSKTSFAAHKGKHRYALNGVLLVIEPGIVRMVATDGRRLAHIERKTKSTEGAETSVIVPSKALEQIIRVLGDDDQTVQVSITGNQLIARTRQATVSALLVEGHFPPYDTVIPKDCDKKLDVSRDRLASAVRRAALVTSEDSSCVFLQLEPGRMVISSAAPETGEARVELPVEYQGEEIRVGFNPGFITDFLSDRVVKEETVRMELRDSGSAGLFRGGKGFVYVVMPVSRE